MTGLKLRMLQRTLKRFLQTVSFKLPIMKFYFCCSKRLESLELELLTKLSSVKMSER